MAPVVPFIPLIGAAVSTVGTVVSVVSSMEAADAAEEQAEANVAAAEATAAREEEVLEEEQEYRRSLAKAKSAASGVGGYTTEVYLAALEASDTEELDWKKQVGESNVVSEELKGEYATSQAMSNVWGGVGSFGSSVITLGDAINTYKSSKSSSSS